MTDPESPEAAPSDDETQAEDDELARIIEAMETAGLVATYERPDGTIAVRLTERGEALRQVLPDVEATSEDDGSA